MSLYKMQDIVKFKRHISKVTGITRKPLKILKGYNFLYTQTGNTSEVANILLGFVRTFRLDGLPDPYIITYNTEGWLGKEKHAFKVEANVYLNYNTSMLRKTSMYLMPTRTILLK